MGLKADQKVVNGDLTESVESQKNLKILKCPFVIIGNMLAKVM